MIQVGAQPARIVFGALLIVVILLMPDGLMAAIEPQGRSRLGRRRPIAQEESRP